MPRYRRAYAVGGTYFFTVCTFERVWLFDRPERVAMLRKATASVMSESPFEIVAAVVLPDHLHWLWRLPEGDADYSKRIGMIKKRFTELHGSGRSDRPSRQRHRESDTWQRRFWEHVVRDQEDLNNHLNYIHYNPVRHGYCACPHQWEASSFRRWVEKRVYPQDWCCACDGREVTPPYPDDFAPFE